MLKEDKGMNAKFLRDELESIAQSNPDIQVQETTKAMVHLHKEEHWIKSTPIELQEIWKQKNEHFHFMKQQHAILKHELKHLPLSGSISLKQAMRELESRNEKGEGYRANIVYVSKEGNVREFKKVCLSKYAGNVPKRTKRTGWQKGWKKTDGYEKFTKEIFIEETTEIKSLNIRQIIGFNNQWVEWI